MKKIIETAKLEDQEGDDGDDAPFQDNAGAPHEWNERRGSPYTLLTRVYFSSPFELPEDQSLSVTDLNHRRVPWLTSGNLQIWAGTPISEFKKLIKEDGGEIYVRDT